jgi:hypothetical protein
MRENRLTFRLALVALLAIALLFAFGGCESADDDDDDDSADLQDLPSDLHGNWYLAAFQDVGATTMNGMDSELSGFLSNRMAMGSYGYSVEGAFGTHEGDAAFRTVGTDEFLVLQPTDATFPEVPLLYRDENQIRLDWPVLDGSGNQTEQLVVLLSGDAELFLGVLVDESQEPVADASVTVYLDGSEVATTTSDEVGIFTAPITDAGTVRVVAQSDDGSLGVDEAVNAFGPPDANEFTLTEMASTGTLAGMVTDSETSMDPTSEVTISCGSQSVTSTDGTYIIRDLEPGDYTVTASADGYQNYSADLTIAEGNNVHNINLVPASSETGTVTGTIEDETTGVQPSYMVTITLNGVELNRMSGDYTFEDVPYGTYTLTATCYEYEDYSATVTLESETLTHNIVLTPESGSSSGQIASLEMYWALSSADYDLMLETPEIEGDTYVIAYGGGSLTSAPYAEHQGDETSGPATETILIDQTFTGTYTVYVSAWVNDTFANDGASFTFKDAEGSVIQQITPPDSEGDYWHIGTFDGTTHELTIVNEVNYTSPAGASPPPAPEAKVR